MPYGEVFLGHLAYLLGNPSMDSPRKVLIMRSLKLFVDRPKKTVEQSDEL